MELAAPPAEFKPTILSQGAGDYTYSAPVK